MSNEVEAERLFMEGVVTSQAFNAPKELLKLRPTVEIDQKQLPAMLRVPGVKTDGG